MPRRTKITALLFFSIVLAAMLLLAFSLKQLEFQPGVPFSLERSAVESFSFSSWSSDLGLLVFVRILIGLALLSLPFILLYMLFNKKTRKRLLIYLLIAGIIIAIGSSAAGSLSAQELPQQLSQPAEQSLPEQPGAPVATYNAAPPADTVVIATIIILALALAVGIGALLFQRKPVQRQIEPNLEPLVQPAEQALQSLYAGGDFKQTVIRCYLEMSAALDRQQGIRRANSMTAHEFERLLAQKGLPKEPVHNLTRLFEGARYSPETPGSVEKQQALTSLQAILKACRRGA